MEEFKNAFVAFKEATKELSRLWLDYQGKETFSKDYPFNESFDELTLKVMEWTDTCVEKIQKN